jgi:hypothetical protein
MVKVAIYSTTPIAGAPWLMYHCLKKYADDIDVRHIQQRNRYGDGRVFPKDMLINNSDAKNFIKKADVVHIHNYLPPELEKLIDFKCQKVVATLHSIPRQGNWKHLIDKADETYCIRQPMQMAEYRGFKSLPNMFDIWQWFPLPNKQYDGTIGIVYCPSNKHQDDKRASKGYHTVMPIIERLAKRGDINLIHHTNVEYFKNLRLKREGHIFIDDIIGKGWHLTSIEGAAFGGISLNNTPATMGYPFVETNKFNIEETLMKYINNRQLLQQKSAEARKWLEDNWNPVEQVREYMQVYNS